MIKNTFSRKKYYALSKRIEREEEERKIALPVSCPSCSARIAAETLWRNLKVCPKCRHHFPLKADERIDLLIDKDSFQEIDAELTSIDILEFPGYQEKLEEAQEKTASPEAIITGIASIAGHKLVLGVMEPNFMMASMGSVVGEKVCRAAEQALELSCPLLICSCSGGARMQEGMVALMQMAKTSTVLAKFNQAGLLYISLLTHPTTGGVTASFASLADIILAEPGALIGFAGPRVIKQTIGQQLPPSFQRAEFLLEHGMIDHVVERTQLKTILGSLLGLHQGGYNGKKTV